MIIDKPEYMDDETREKVMKVLAPDIIKMKMRNFACVLPILLSVYLTLHICHPKISADDM